MNFAVPLKLRRPTKATHNVSNLQAHEYEDDAQKLDTLEREGNLVARDVGRLAQVERALKKIEEGSYGVSDVSDHPIPKERLEAMPEATNTLSEQEAGEGSHRRDS
jgi:DnaK suppressor protein